MAEANVTTKRVPKVVEEERIVLTMTREEAEAVHNLLWLTEFAANTGSFKALNDVQGALSDAIRTPNVERIRFDTGNRYNSRVAIWLTENDN